MTLTWQPIETAPGDGRRMLLAGTAEGFSWLTIGSFDTARDAWVSDVNLRLREPTHWMPLPEPPA